MITRIKIGLPLQYNEMNFIANKYRILRCMYQLYLGKYGTGTAVGRVGTYLQYIPNVVR